MCYTGYCMFITVYASPWGRILTYDTPYQPTSFLGTLMIVYQ